MESNIATMDIVYEGAVMTIIAASGSHAECRIPGVKCNRQVSQTVDIKPGVIVTIYNDLDSLLSKTIYSQRGWT